MEIAITPSLEDYTSKSILFCGKGNICSSQNSYVDLGKTADTTETWATHHFTKRLNAAPPADEGTRAPDRVQTSSLRTHQFAVMLLFFEILKLMIQSREQDTLSRREELMEALKHIQKEVDSLKKQSKNRWTTGLMVMGMACASAAMPIIGYAAGDTILEQLGRVFKSLQGMPADKFTRGIEKMLGASSKLAEANGQSFDSFCQSGQTYDGHMSRLLEEKMSEITRSISEGKSDWDDAFRFLSEFFRMYFSTSESLYRN